MTATDSSARWNQCRSCWADIRWAVNQFGEWIPLNPEPDPTGTHVLLSDRERIFSFPTSLVVAEEPTKRAISPNAAHRHRDHRTVCGTGPGVRAAGDSAYRWLRGDTRGAAPIPQVAQLRK